MSVLERWHHRVHEIPRAGIRQRREAGPDLCAAVAEELGVPACHTLTAEYKIHNEGRGRFGLAGMVRAEFTRQCVITLEPIREQIDEPLDCTFVPPAELSRSQSEEEEALSVEDLEAITQDTIDVGRIVYEVLASAIEPYPRKPDATYEPPQAPTATKDEQAPNPFAALARLKQTRDDPSR